MLLPSTRDRTPSADARASADCGSRAPSGVTPPAFPVGGPQGGDSGLGAPVPVGGLSPPYPGIRISEALSFPLHAPMAVACAGVSGVFGRGSRLATDSLTGLDSI